MKTTSRTTCEKYSTDKLSVITVQVKLKANLHRGKNFRLCKTKSINDLINMLKSLVLLNFKRNDDVKWVSFDFMTTCALKLGTIKLVQIFPGDLNQRVESCSLKPMNYLKVFTVREGGLPVLGLRMWVGKSKVKLRVLWLTEVWSHAPINGDHSSPRPLWMSRLSDAQRHAEWPLQLYF